MSLHKTEEFHAGNLFLFSTRFFEDIVCLNWFSMYGIADQTRSLARQLEKIRWYLNTGMKKGIHAVQSYMRFAF